MLCSNIRGLRNNFVELTHVIANRKPDVFFLNETHVTNACDICDLKLKNYDFYKCDSYSKRTGGVCVYINKNIKHNKVTVVEQKLAWYISLEINISGTPTIMACVYLSATESKCDVLDSFEKWLDEISDSKPVILSGDFNIDLLCDETYSRRLRNICDENGLSILVDKPTRIENGSATLIDLCVSNVDKRRISCLMTTKFPIMRCSK